MRRRRKEPTTARRDDYSAKTRTAGHGKETTVHVRWQDELPSAVSGIDAWDIGVAGQTC
jgi:hypothetical protein